ncbi:hypothetical protein RJT34_03180 [Clitoria ternatea]|uniref:RING-type E3 ubiquitin transferase n=1 Tax=Clitoria ternatea TaxID=43366 RepID=A0AAN9KLR3_CLITE
MFASTSFTSQLVHDLLVDTNSRKLLLQDPLLHQSLNSQDSTTNNNYNSTDSYFRAHDFDANVVMILSVLLCAVICSLGLNSIVRCALRCSNIAINDSSSSSSGSNNNNNPSPRLANKGIKKKALKTFPIISYSTEVKHHGLDTECVICISEFTSGDKVRILPKCNHGFHVRCIDKWLSSHSSCPKCRHCLIDTCRKIVASQLPLPVPETIIRIQPLEPEGLERNYRELS